MTPLLIGITGVKRAGKNETGQAIVDRYDESVALGFADLVKVAGARALGFDRTPEELIALMDEFKESAKIDIHYVDNEDRQLATELTTLHQLTGREYLQFFGTESARNTYGFNFWVDQALPPATHGGLHVFEGKDVVVLTDVRFDNEAQRIKDLGGFNIEVRRPGYEGDGHASEAGVSPELLDYIIENSGDLHQLAESVETVLNDIES